MIEYSFEYNFYNMPSVFFVSITFDISPAFFKPKAAAFSKGIELI